MAHNNNWSNLKSKQYYAIEAWGNNYFDINTDGKITVQKSKYSPNSKAVLSDIVKQACLQYNIQTPMLLRFTDIIKSRVERLVFAFNKAIKENNYPQQYNLIYPIKANQHIGVVKTINDTKSLFTGLEAGSKPELIAVLSIVNDNQTPIICNGYKDYDYIKLALMARKLGRNITIVVEKMPELYNIIKLSKEFNVTPLIGVRCRLALTLAGKWAHSGGDKSKFGLNTTQILKLINELTNANMLECLHLIHCHQGSQIANLTDIKHYIYELTNFYVSLHKMGATIKVLDIGGGLAIDYEGSRSRSYNSANYSLSDYANTIISTIQEVCMRNNITAPTIYSESGRASTAHHAVFVTNIVEIEDNLYSEQINLEDYTDSNLQELTHLLSHIKTIPANEVFSASQNAITAIHNKFSDGVISMECRAKGERLYYAIKQKLLSIIDPAIRGHREMYDFLEEDLASKIIANFSLFQTLPDAWAIKQLFPILPLTNLNEPLSLNAIIEDITCDSDGKIDQYSSVNGINKTIKLPAYNAQNPYLLGAFLVGTYQEILGNLHNLFGIIPVIEVKLHENKAFEIISVNQGFTNNNSLNFVGYTTEELLSRYNKLFKAQPETVDFVKLLLNQHTYLS